jgi:hypothetical protein
MYAPSTRRGSHWIQGASLDTSLLPRGLKLPLMQMPLPLYLLLTNKLTLPFLITEFKCSFVQTGHILDTLFFYMFWNFDHVVNIRICQTTCCLPEVETTQFVQGPQYVCCWRSSLNNFNQFVIVVNMWCVKYVMCVNKVVTMFSSVHDSVSEQKSWQKEAIFDWKHVWKQSVIRLILAVKR